MSFVCQECKGVFKAKRSLQRHIDSSHKKVKFPCEACGTLFARKDNLKSHIKWKHPELLLENIIATVQPVKFDKKQKSSTSRTKPATPVNNDDATIVYNTENGEDYTESHGMVVNETDDYIASLYSENESVQPSECVLKPNRTEEQVEVEGVADDDGESSMPEAKFSCEVIIHEPELDIKPEESDHECIAIDSDGDEPAPSVNQTNGDDEDTVECIEVEADDEERTEEVNVLHQTDNESFFVHSDGEDTNMHASQIPVIPQIPAQPTLSISQTNLNNTNVVKRSFRCTTPPAKQKRSIYKDNIDFTLLDMLQQNAVESKDEDRMFFLSILSDFKRVRSHRKLQVKAKIVEAIVEALG